MRSGARPLVPSLTRNRLGLGSGCRLDTDLELERQLAGEAGALFGQICAAQQHLKPMCARRRPLVFFGGFRRVPFFGGFDARPSRAPLRSGVPDLRAIYGWIRIGNIVAL